jgi:hypothetical protein
MTTCRNCSRAATLFLCPRCVGELRDMLTGLAIGGPDANGLRAPGWIEHLREAALGQTRLGESGRRTPRYRDRLDGASLLLSHLEPFPDEGEPDLTKARQQRSQAALRHALGAARINLRACELLDYTHSVLVEWCRDICGTRGVPTPQALDTSVLALWLARHVSAIAADQGAHVCYMEIAQIVTDIERVINRPAPLLPLGSCPAQTAHGRCNRALEGRRAAVEVTCPQCHAAHNVEELLARLVVETDDYQFSITELASWALPIVGEPVPASTLRHWAARGWLLPAGHGPDGRPRYRLADVRKRRALGKPQTAATGSAAPRYGKRVTSV